MLRQEAERGQGAVATKTVEDWDKFSAIPTVLFVTNCLTPYRQAMLDAWAAAGRVAIDVLLTMRDGDTKRGWGDTRVSGKGWRMIPGAVPRDIGKYGAVFLGGWDSAIDYLISLVAQMRRVPVLAVIDGVAPSHVAEGCHGLKSVPKRWLVRHAAAILANGTIGRQYAESLGVPEDRLFNQFLAVDVANWTWPSRFHRDVAREELRSQLGIDNRESVVLYVGRLAPEKRVTDLVKAVSLLSTHSTVLIVVGKGGEQAVVQGLARQLGVHCICTGSRTQQELPAWYAAADVFSLPSSEPWGLVVQEAMLSPLPVVVSRDAGCNLDLVRDGINGWTFDCGDIAGLATGLERSLSTPSPLAEAGFAIASDWNTARAGISFVDALRKAGEGRA
jgi:glycosyltransferase involved in cell wall biosynthesis